MGRPLNFNGDPILRMRAYVRASTERSIRNRALLSNKTTGQVIDELIWGKDTRPAKAHAAPNTQQPTKEGPLIDEDLDDNGDPIL
jgi:hypothetical protein